MLNTISNSIQRFYPFEEDRFLLLLDEEQIKRVPEKKLESIYDRADQPLVNIYHTTVLP